MTRALLTSLLLLAGIASTATAEVFWPLEDNRFWVLRGDGWDGIYTQTWQVGPETDLGGETYREVTVDLEFEEFPRAGATIRYLRTDASGRVYEHMGGSDVLWLDVTAGDNDVYPYLDGSITVLHLGTPVVTGAGTFSGCLRFDIDPDESVVDEEYSFLLAPDFGPIRLASFWVYLDLIAYGTAVPIQETSWSNVKAIYAGD